MILADVKTGEFTGCRAPLYIYLLDAGQRRALLQKGKQCLQPVLGAFGNDNDMADGRIAVAGESGQALGPGFILREYAKANALHAAIDFCFQALMRDFFH